MFPAGAKSVPSLNSVHVPVVRVQQVDDLLSGRDGYPEPKFWQILGFMLAGSWTSIVFQTPHSASTIQTIIKSLESRPILVVKFLIVNICLKVAPLWKRPRLQHALVSI